MYKNGHLTYERPVNFQPDWEDLFQPDYKFQKVSLKTREIKNAFVNHYGLVIKNGLLVKGCAPNIGFSNYDESFYFNHWKKGMEQMLVSKYRKSLPSIKLDDNHSYLLVHSPWFSYFFWLTECLPRILRVKDQLSELTLLYPEAWDKYTFVQETLALIPELKIKRIPKDHHLFVKHLVMPEVKPWTPMFLPNEVYMVRDFFKERVKKSDELEIPHKVYLSRKHAGRRKFVDEEKVEQVLDRHGFKAFHFDKLNFLDQIRIMQNAKHVISITGAGLINLLFKELGGSFLDVSNIQYLKTGKYKFHYWKLCCILNIRYLVQFCEHTHDPEIYRTSNYSNQNLHMDYDLLSKNLEIMSSIK